MGEKKSKNNDGGEKKNEDKKEGGNGSITVVLKVDLHCEGCASKVYKSIRNFDGVESVKGGDADGSKVTVIGKIDPVKLREKVEQKTHKKVELLSPLPKKENNNNKEKGKENGKTKNGGEGEKKKDAKDNKDDKKSKEKEPPETTAVLKVNLHCEGCIQKIYKIVSKTKGYKEIKFDRQKELVTVTGAMDMKALAETLKKHLKKEVEILPEKKKEGGGGGGGEKQGKEGGEKKGKGGGGGGGGSGGEKQGKEGGNQKKGNDGDGGEKMENRLQVEFGYPYPYMYGPGPGHGGEQQFQYYPYHAPQIFSDENPNACTVM